MAEKEKKKYTVKAIAAVMDTTIEGLADQAGIAFDHLKGVSCGRLRMTADDLLKLSAVSGIDPFDIKAS